MSRNKLLLAILILICSSSISFAQTTGKIAGTVIDKENGEPLAGANVIIEDKLLGGATDIDGFFYILNVPPGVYNVQASMIGYGSMIIQSVRVHVNSTTKLEFELAEETFESEAIIVVADAIGIKKDQTSSIRTVSDEELAALPVENLRQVVNTQAGVVDGHFRGGRDTEVAYMIDGINIANVFSGNSKSTEIDVEIISELEVITGTFNAEYGKAMSGVVNAVTKEGSNQFGGSFSSSFANYFTTNDDVFIGLNNGNYLTRNLSQDYKLQLEGPIIKDKLFFLVNYRRQNINGYLNGIELFKPTDFSIYPRIEPETWYTESTGDGDYVSMEQSEIHTAFGKLTYKISNNAKLSFFGTYNDDISTNYDEPDLNTYDGDRSDFGYDHHWKYNPSNPNSLVNRSYMGALSFNHVISNSMFWDLKVSYNQQKFENYLFKDPLDDRYVSTYYRLGESETNFYTGGVLRPGKEMDTFSNGHAKLDVYWQVSQKHGIKAGLSATLYEIDRDRIDVRNIYEGGAGEGEAVIDSATGKVSFPNYELQIVEKSDKTLDVYTVKPYDFAAYIQDKMEFDDLVINIGLRFDYFNPDQVYPSDRRNPGNQLVFADSLNRTSVYKKAPAKTQLSPRLGIAYQLGETAVLRFSYGHFLQMPPMYALYKNNVFRVPTSNYGVTMGNALLEPEKTVTYEIGFWQKLTENMSLELALYYKDIFNLLSTEIRTTYNQIKYGLYTNKDYGNARGLELKYKCHMGRFYSNVNYTLSYTKGNADNPVQTFTRAGENQDPIKRYIPMSWDQRHTLNIVTGYSTKDYGLTLAAYYNSGRPYTYEPLDYTELARINLYTNNDYRPSTFKMDLTSYWRLPIFENYDIRLVLNIYNLLDALNDNEVDAQTGKAYNHIVTETAEKNYKSDFTDVYDQFKDPSMYNAPRQIKLGLEFIF